MIKYRVSTWSLSPEAVEVTRETNCFVFLATGQRESKDGGHGYFDTWQEAKDFLVTQTRNRLASLREDLMREQAWLSKLQAVQPPEDNNA